MPTLNKIIEILERIAPLSLAEKWDNVGLLLGDANSLVNMILTCLTITQSVVTEAIQKQAGLIVSHHPILFKPTQRIVTSSEEGRLLWQLARHDIAVYSPHTAYDNAMDGINDQLAQLLGLQNIQPLVPQTTSPSFKLITFVPEDELEAVSQSLFHAGAGRIGNYAQCSFRTEGIGTFHGNAASHPTIGQIGRQEQVKEVKLEVVCSQDCLQSAVGALRQAHSYEEPAIDIVPLHSIGNSNQGAGRMGQLSKPMTPQALAELISTQLSTSVSITGDQECSPIQSIAIVCGAGGSLLQRAIQAGADALLTGEIRFHDELAAQAAGVTVLAAGHYATERPGVEKLAARLTALLPDCTVWASSDEQNPARMVTCPSNSSSD